MSGESREQHFSVANDQPQQGEIRARVEDDPRVDSSTTPNVHLYTQQPNQFPGEQQWDNNEATRSHEDRGNFTVESINRSRGGGGGGGGSGSGSISRSSGSNRRFGRRQHGGRGLRQGGGGKQHGRGRRQQLQGSGSSTITTSDRSNSARSSTRSSSDDDTDITSPLEPDTSQQHTNAIILMLQRLSDRLSGIEVLQRQQTERISTINYRLTKLELQAEERKSITSDLSNAVQHRMETTDAELDQVNTQLDGIKTSLMSLGQQYGDLKDTVREITTAQDNRESEVNGLKMQAMAGTLQGLRTTTDDVKENIDQLSRNLTSLNRIATNLTHINEKMVTKQYLYENLNELRSQDSAMSLLAKVMTVQSPATTTSRRGSPRREPEDCWQILRKGRKKSGVYSIQPRYALTPFFVYCDMETDGGGWTVIQRREDGSVDFLREWADYKHGFGNIAGEYWLGNEKIHLLTNQQVSVLRVDLADYDQQVGHALYSAFAIGSELEGYSLKMLGQYSGDAGDSLRYHVGRRFSTIDVDNDAWPEQSCARDHMGAWWYRACETSNLNGRYLHGPIPAEHQYTGLYWYDFRGPQYSLWRSRMMVRRGGKVDHPVFKNFTEVRHQTDTERVESSSQQEEAATTPSSETFNPNRDPYVTFEY